MSIWRFCFVCLSIFALGLLAAGITQQPLLLLFFVPFVILVAAAFKPYRPHENCVGAVDLFGRLWRLVNPNEWIILIRPLQRVRCEKNLVVRAVPGELRDVNTRDNVPVNLTLKVFYQFDPRRVSPDLRVNMLNLEERLIGDMILTNLEDIVRNQVMINTQYANLSSSSARWNLALGISAVLSKQVENFGIRIHPKNGVKIIDLQPNEQFKSAMCFLSAASMQGRAALERMQPLFEDMRTRYPGIPWDAVGLTIASALTQNGDLPQVVFPQNPYTLYGVGDGYRAAIPESKGGNKGL